MAKQSYELKDIYDYLLKYYNVEWIGYNILNKGVERQVKQSDFKTIDNENELNVVAVVYNGAQRQNVELKVSNRFLNIDIDKEPTIRWAAFLANRYSQEQSL